MTLEDKAEKTWNAAYPDRRPWADIEPEARAEWLRIFAIFEATEEK